MWGFLLSQRGVSVSSGVAHRRFRPMCLTRPPSDLTSPESQGRCGVSSPRLTREEFTTLVNSCQREGVESLVIWTDAERKPFGGNRMIGKRLLSSPETMTRSALHDGWSTEHDRGRRSHSSPPTNNSALIPRFESRGVPALGSIKLSARSSSLSTN